MPAQFTVGLTGGIASGKSLIQSAFEALHVPVLDADRVAREVVAVGEPALAEIAAAFGADLLQADGSLDRRRMREHVFADPAARKRLEGITHPHIRRRIRAWLAAQSGPYCILSVAILIEARMTDLVDRVLVVDCPVEHQLQRLMQRDGIDETLARAMLTAQASREQRLAIADDVLENCKNPEVAIAAVAQMHAHYLSIARQNSPKAPGLRLPHSVI